MKIAQVITGSAAIGGAQIHLRDLSTGLKERGHECTILIGPPHGLYCDQLRERNLDFHIVPMLRKALHPVHDFIALLQLRAKLRNIQPDIVAAHTAKAGFLARVAAAELRIPCLFTPHGLSVIDRSTGRSNRLFTMLERVGGRIGSGMITVCHAEQVLAETSGIISEDKSFLVHNGIPDCGKPSCEERRELIVVMVARFQRPKDHVTLIRALARLGGYPWRLQLVGAGPLMSSVRELARSLGVADRVDFLGERADIHRVLSTAAIFVLSTHWEAFPLSILEAMRAELPIIASNVGGIREAIRHNVNGILVPPSSPELLAQQLKRLFDEPLLREHLGRTARQKFLQSFTADKMIDKTLCIYDAVVAAKNMRVALESARSSAS